MQRLRLLSMWLLGASIAFSIRTGHVTTAIMQAIIFVLNAWLAWRDAGKKEW